METQDHQCCVLASARSAVLWEFRARRTRWEQPGQVMGTCEILLQNSIQNPEID